MRKHPHSLTRHGQKFATARPRARARQNGAVTDPLDVRSVSETPVVPAGAGDAAGAEGADGDGPATLSDAERAERLGELQGLIELMRPAVQADGGDLVLVAADVETGVVEVQLQGACSSCAVSGATLQGGVERILTGRLPWVTEVIGGLDDSLDEFESASLGRGGYVPGF